MICPHCGVTVKFEFDEFDVYPSKSYDAEKTGYVIGMDNCPSCGGFVALLQYGKIAMTADKSYNYLCMNELLSEKIIFPAYSERVVQEEVPDGYKKEFQEACAVLSISPKSSAALNRRLLQQILREEYGYQHKSLAQEIEDFIKKADVPTYVKDAVDAVRNVGNFAAHPLKDTNTGEIVDVEPGEAEWLTEVIEALFDITFVQPKRLEERQKNLNAKLNNLGKPPMKKS